MRKTLCALALVAAMGGIGGGGTLVAADGPQRPAGDVLPIAPSDNGGDHGWGNCGHNSSGGNPPVDGGNGGYSAADCGTAPTDSDV
jgi:hypothetical protein